MVSFEVQCGGCSKVVYVGLNPEKGQEAMKEHEKTCPSLLTKRRVEQLEDDLETMQEFMKKMRMDAEST